MKKNVQFVLLSFVIVLMIGCSRPTTDVDVEGTVQVEVAQSVELTVTALATDTPVPTTSPTFEPTAADSVAAATAVSTPLPAETTSSSPPNGGQMTRRQLFAALAEMNTAVIDQVTAAQDLLIVDPALNDAAWVADVTTIMDAIHTSYAEMVAFEVPAQGRQAHDRSIDAIGVCDAAATAVTTAVSAGDEAQMRLAEEDLSNCIHELVSLNSAFTQGNGSRDADNTPAPTFEARGCAGESTGFVPLIDLGTDTYQGFAGGLYPGGLNERPAELEAAGLALADEIAPINGRIVILSVGMSNTRHEFDTLIEVAAQDDEINPEVLFVNGAVSGRASQTIDSPTAQYWELVDKRLARANATAEDVQVVWLKEAHSFPGRPFPDDALTFLDELRRIVDAIGQNYPNVKMIFLSSRIYAGYANAELHPEPYAYQSGFSVKWLIEEYINGELSENTPWIAWGPYLWADGVNPRSDGLTWVCDELIGDGTHPSDSGREKVANMLIDFFKTDTVTRDWFLNQ
ncbi:MAG: hypothetical protein KC419_21175 [Anaerolineales bacterium]|nr:hypothetical protein [Anaerolineales bacterium]